MRVPSPPGRFSAILAVAATALVVVACGRAAASASIAVAPSSPAPTSATSNRPGDGLPSSLPSSAGASPTESTAPDTAGSTAAGDIPDNAVFLTYHGTAPTFSIQYVEGWQVTRQPAGVTIRDKDSSETVAVVAAGDVPAYIASTDLPALQAQAAFKLVKQDTVKVGSTSYVHLVFHLPAPPDPVTGKQVPSTVDRYYVAGPTGLAVISLSTPDGVDNVDAFRQMIGSFKWS